MPQPDIYLLGIRIQEPVTTLTDIILACTCFYAYWKLTKKGNLTESAQYFRYYFLMMGMGILAGGIIGHGFQYIFGFKWKLLGWVISMIAVMLIERSAIGYTINLIPTKLHDFILRLNIFELIAALCITFYSLNFKYVEWHAAYGFMMVVFSAHLFCYLKTKDKGSRFMLYGILILILTVFVFNYPVYPHVWFNHADLSHVLMTIVCLLFLKAALSFKEPPSLEKVS